jgi:predicted nucleic acid-binding protein
VYGEVANTLVKYVRAGAMSGGMALERLEQILEAPLAVHPTRSLARRALGFAVLRNLSVYDACYLALAVGYDAVLVTADRRLAEAADRAALLPHDGPPAAD